MGKKLTFAAARERLMSTLRQRGWTVTTSNLGKTLKMPYATSPNGRLRLWFKPQAVHYTMSDDGRHDRSTMHTVAYGLDIRDEDPGPFVDWLSRRSMGPLA